MPDTAHATARDDRHQPRRRKFLYLATGAVAATGGAAAVWPLIDSLNPNADDIALLPISYNLRAVRTGGPT
jgi:ubiquinol-cytochrome c reductase iron-sulfur subunit